MVPVSPVNPVFPINGQQYSVQPVMVTPGFPMPYPGNMQQLYCKKYKKKKKKKEKSDSESESDTESEYYYVRKNGHHFRKSNRQFNIHIRVQYRPIGLYVNLFYLNYNSTYNYTTMAIP